MSRWLRTALPVVALAWSAIGICSSADVGSIEVTRSPATFVSPAARADSGERELRVSVAPVVWRGAGDSVYPEIAGFGRLGEWGAPDVPARRERVAIEPGGSLEIAGVEALWEEGVIPGALAAYPAEPPGTGALDLELWKGAGNWPADPVRLLTNDGAFRTLRFAEILVTPVQVDVAAGRFRVAREIVVRLRRIGVGGLSRGALFDPLVESLAGQLAHGAAEVGRSIASFNRGATAVGAGEAEGVAATTFPAWQVEVDREGLHRITYAWALTNLPGLTSQNPQQFRMTVQGVEVPIELVGDGDTVFEAGESIVFYGQPAGRIDLFAADHSLDYPWKPGFQGGDFTDVNVYRIDVAAGAARIAADPWARGPQSGYTQSTSFRTTVRHESDQLFLGLIPEDGVDHWYVNPLINAGCTATASCTDARPASHCRNLCSSGQTCCGSAVEQTVSTPGSVGGSVNLRVRLLAIDRAVDLHRTEVYVGGTLRDTDDWDGYVEHTHEVTLTGPLAASTAVKVRMPLGRVDPGTGQNVEADAAGYNWVEFDYDRNYAVVSDALVFEGPNANREIGVAGVSGTPRIWEITETTTTAAGMAIATPRRVDGVQLVGSEARFEYDLAAGLPATRRFVAAGPAGLLTPKAGREDKAPSTFDASFGSSLKAPGLGADWLVIAHRSLINTSGGTYFSQLRSRRQAQGLDVALVDVRDVYDEFTEGIEDPQAIRDFIAWTQANWTPAPTYVLLVGDATRDYKNLYAYSPSRQFVPTYMIDRQLDPQFDYYLSDTWFGAVVGSDAISDVLIGRIPAHSQAEAEAVFKKIVTYEQNGPYPASWSGHAMLVAENDSQYNFFAYQDSIHDRWFSAGPQTADKVYELDPAVVGCQQAADDVKARIKSGVNAGAAVLGVVSHGGYKNWGKGCSMFTSDDPAADDVDQLTNVGKLQFQVHANCISGHFSQDAASGTTNDPWYTFLEDWVVTADKGVVAGIAPSFLAFSYRIDQVLNPVFEAIYGRTKERVVGHIDLLMRLVLESGNDIVSVRSYVLEGDPATRLWVPAPNPPTITSISEAGSGQLQVQWTSVPGATKYRLYRSAYPNCCYERVAETTGLSFVDGGMSNCQEYFYYAVAVDADGFESRWSNFNDTCLGSPRDPADCKSGTPENPNSPAQVIGVTVEDTQVGGQLRVLWSTANQGSDVLRYRVFYGTTSGGPYTGSSVAEAPRSSLVLGGLTDRTPYYVVVRAEHCTLNGPLSAQASGVPHRVEGINPPDAINDLRVTKQSSTQLKLTWTVPTQSVWGVPTTVSSVEVYGGQSGPVFPLDIPHRLQVVAPPTREWLHGVAAPAAGPWWYTVVAVDGGGLRSAGGDELPDGVDDMVVAKGPGVGQVTLSWSPLDRDMDGRPIVVAGYNLYGRNSVLPRAQCAAGNLLVGDIVGTTIVRPLPADTLFTWQLLAEDVRGAESVW